MLHPAYKTAWQASDLPTALTPIYPTVAGLPQAYLRKAVLAGSGAGRPGRYLCTR